MPMIANFALRNPPLPEPEVVYFTAVLWMMEKPAYAQALRLVKKRHPFGAILSAKVVWSNRESWLATQRHIMAIATHVYVVPQPDRTIGIGLLGELLHAKNLDPAPSLFLIAERRIEKIREVQIIPEGTPTCCGRLITDESIAEEEARKAADATLQIVVTKKSTAKKRHAGSARISKKR
jgi:hypothetical protein